MNYNWPTNTHYERTILINMLEMDNEFAIYINI